jgi:hypothetical protein
MDTLQLVMRCGAEDAWGSVAVLLARVIAWARFVGARFLRGVLAFADFLTAVFVVADFFAMT